MAVELAARPVGSRARYIRYLRGPKMLDADLRKALRKYASKIPALSIAGVSPRLTGGNFLVSEAAWHRRRPKLLYPVERLFKHPIFCFVKFSICRRWFAFSMEDAWQDLVYAQTRFVTLLRAGERRANWGGAHRSTLRAFVYPMLIGGAGGATLSRSTSSVGARRGWWGVSGCSINSNNAATTALPTASQSMRTLESGGSLKRA